MKIVVYWEHSSERAIAVGLIAPLRKSLRALLHGRITNFTVAAHSFADGLTEERTEFDAAIEKAFAAEPRPETRKVVSEITMRDGRKVRTVRETYA